MGNSYKKYSREFFKRTPEWIETKLVMNVSNKKLTKGCYFCANPSYNLAHQLGLLKLTLGNLYKNLIELVDVPSKVMIKCCSDLNSRRYSVGADS